ncbi:unnamed protein product [Moneuplotes crassus]|uniref:Thioredoxin-like fold domain-containing protein n=1 Tax=Euplotes crassus TaxID=5936 RepID=A0AAD2D4V7_EUPCR|nr:unnamed protein product [Moneuplotes crassus]
MKYIVLLGLVLAVTFAQVPVPDHPQGYLYREAPLAKLRMDIYEDLLCGDCKNFDPPFKQFLNTTHDGRPITDFIEVYFHPYILPIHINAFTMTQLTPYIWDLNHDGEVNAAFNEWAFEHQLEFKGPEGMAMSQYDVIDKTCHDTADRFGYTEAECLDVLRNGTYEQEIHKVQKYGTWYRVYTTPGVFLNGVMIEDIPETADAWTRFINRYLR